MVEQIPLARLEVTKRRFRSGEVQFSETPRGIINEDQERAGWSTLFKPSIRRAIYLHQFAETRPPLAQGMHHRLFGALGLPQASGNHQLTHRLTAHIQTVDFGQFLVRQCGTEVGIATLKPSHGFLFGGGFSWWLLCRPRCLETKALAPSRR